MSKRAKCKLCNSIIESKYKHDYVACVCGEIAIDGGDEYFHVNIKSNKSNLIIVDDEGNEIIPKQVDTLADEIEPTEANTSHHVSKDDLLKMLEEMTKRVSELPKHAMLAPITHADYYSLLLLLSALFKSF